jgi:hypothetical protein
MALVQFSVNQGAGFTAGPDILTQAVPSIAVAGNGTLAAVISSYSGDVWLHTYTPPVASSSARSDFHHGIKIIER